MASFDLANFDFEVGTDATAPALLPGKDQATTGHSYVAIFPKKEDTSGAEKHPEKHPEKHQTTSGQDPSTVASRATIRDEPRDTPTDRHPSPGAAPTLVHTHVPGGKERKIKTDDQGIGAFRAAQPQEQKPTIGPKYTDDIPWAEPVTAGDTLTGATSQDVHNAPVQNGYSGQGMTSGEFGGTPEGQWMGRSQPMKDEDKEPGLRRGAGADAGADGVGRGSSDREA